jgi:hypothetical protein
MQIKEPFVVDKQNAVEPTDDQLNSFAITPTDRRQKVSGDYIRKINNNVVIPQFNLGSFAWLGSSYIVRHFFCNLPSSFTLLELPAPNLTFCATIRYDVAEVPTRFKLWENVGELLYIPLYNGEVIHKDFFIEIWTINSGDDIVNETPLILQISRLLKPDLSNRDFCPQFGANGIDESTKQEGTDLIFDLTGFDPSNGDFYTTNIPSGQTILNHP